MHVFVLFDHGLNGFHLDDNKFNNVSPLTYIVHDHREKEFLTYAKLPILIFFYSHFCLISYCTL